MTIYFKCGCVFTLTCVISHEQSGLACCVKHERPNAVLRDLGPMEVDDIEYRDIR